MPLKTGKSDKAFKSNVKTEYEAGKPLKQSLAIAYSMKRKAKKMAKGGDAGSFGVQDETSVKGVSYPGRLLRGSKEDWEKDASKKLRRGYHEGNIQEIRNDHKDRKYLANGGQITDNYQSSCTEHCVQPCTIHSNQDSGYEKHEGDVKRPDAAAMTEDERKLNQHGAHEVGRQGNEGHYAEGGETRGVHRASGEGKSKGVSEAGEEVRVAQGARADAVYKNNMESAKAKHHQILGELMSDRRDRKFMAEGGYAESVPKSTYHPDHTSETDPTQMARKMAEGGQITDNYADTEDGDGRDMVGRIMAQRAQEFSRGGQVANQEHGEDNNELAGFSPNEFDDLVLRDDDIETADYTGANSGDDLSSPGEDQRRKDMVSQIMKSRKKKDKLPNPR